MSKDLVNHPPHYQGKNGLEVIDVIEGFDVGSYSPTSGFNIGNLLKYVLRAGSKGRYVEDLKKGVWYLSREIANQEKERDPQLDLLLVDEKNSVCLGCNGNGTIVFCGAEIRCQICNGARVIRSLEDNGQT